MTFTAISRPRPAFALRIAALLSRLLGAMTSLSRQILEHPRVFQHLALPRTWREFLDLLGDEARPQPRAAVRLRSINDALIAVERAFTDERGLRGRTWYTHQIYAPGFYTGYSVKTMPAVREAIELKQWKLADESIVLVAQVLQNEAALISEAAAKLEAAAK